MRKLFFCGVGKGFLSAQMKLDRPRKITSPRISLSVFFPRPFSLPDPCRCSSWRYFKLLYITHCCFVVVTESRSRALRPGVRCVTVWRQYVTESPLTNPVGKVPCSVLHEHRWVMPRFSQCYPPWSRAIHKLDLEMLSLRKVYLTGPA